MIFALGQSNWAATGSGMASTIGLRAIDSVEEGRKPDDALSAQAKLRSKQNTFMAVPVVFLMISNHFPGVTYGDRNNWIVLAVLVLAGWIAAKFIRRA